MKGHFQLIGTVHFVNVTGLNAAPSTDTIFDCGRWDEIIIQADALEDINHVATNCDINVISKPPGATNWDTTPYAEILTIADNEVRSEAVVPPPPEFKLRCDMNTGTRADIYVRVFGRG